MEVASSALAKATVISLVSLLYISWLMPKSAIASEIDLASFQILEANCNHCHGMPNDDPAGDFSLVNFDSRQSVLSQRSVWRRVLDVVDGHEMPPAEEDSLDAQNRQAPNHLDQRRPGEAGA